MTIRMGSCGLIYTYFHLQNRSIKRRPMKRETAAKYLSGLFRGIDNFDVRKVVASLSIDYLYGLYE